MRLPYVFAIIVATSSVACIPKQDIKDARDEQNKQTRLAEDTNKVAHNTAQLTADIYRKVMKEEPPVLESDAPASGKNANGFTDSDLSPAEFEAKTVQIEMHFRDLLKKACETFSEVTVSITADKDISVMPGVGLEAGKPLTLTPQMCEMARAYVKRQFNPLYR